MHEGTAIRPIAEVLDDKSALMFHGAHAVDREMALYDLGTIPLVTEGMVEVVRVRDGGGWVACPDIPLDSIIGVYVNRGAWMTLIGRTEGADLPERYWLYDAADHFQLAPPYLKPPANPHPAGTVEHVAHGLLFRTGRMESVMVMRQEGADDNALKSFIGDMFCEYEGHWNDDGRADCRGGANATIKIQLAGEEQWTTFAGKGLIDLARRVMNIPKPNGPQMGLF